MEERKNIYISASCPNHNTYHLRCMSAGAGCWHGWPLSAGSMVSKGK